MEGVLWERKEKEREGTEKCVGNGDERVLWRRG